MVFRAWDDFPKCPNSIGESRVEWLNVAHSVSASPKGGRTESHSRVFPRRQGTRQSCDSKSAHTLPSICASSQSPRMISNRLFPGSSLDVDILQSGSESRARNFSSSVMKTCLRTGGQSDLFYTVVGLQLQQSPFPCLCGMEEIPYSQKKPNSGKIILPLLSWCMSCLGIILKMYTVMII